MSEGLWRLLLKIASITLGLIAFIFALLGVWWWALAGISQEVGTAIIFTVLLLGSTAPLLWLAGDWKD
jgi:hypothetical protein